MNFTTIYKEIKHKKDPVEMENFINELNEFVINKLDKKFNKIFGKYKKMVYEMFENTKCVISGSVILQILLNEKWKNSDIDVFYFKENSNPVDDGLYFPDNRINTIIQKFDFELVNEPSCIYQNLFDIRNKDDKYKEITEISNNTGIKINGETIQFICIGTSTKLNKTKLDNTYLINLLSDVFDFDICKNFVKFENKKMICILNNISHILLKKFSCNINYEATYENEKNPVIDNKNNSDFTESYFYLYRKKITLKDNKIYKYSRKSKYLDRGFKFIGYTDDK